MNAVPTTDEQAFVSACLAAPDDSAPWLIYSDWLREHDREAEVGDVAPIRAFVRSLPPAMAIPADVAEMGRTLAEVADWLAIAAGYWPGDRCQLPPVLPHLRQLPPVPLTFGGPWLADIDGDAPQEIELFPTPTGGPPPVPNPPAAVPAGPAVRRRPPEPPFEEMDWLNEPGWR